MENKKFSLEKPREPIKPTMPTMPRKPRKPSVGYGGNKEDIKYVVGTLKKDPKTEQRPEIIQYAKCDGKFRTLVKEGVIVSEGQVIGFIKPEGSDKEIIIRAEANGTIEEVLPGGDYENIGDRRFTLVESDQILFKLTPTTIDTARQFKK